MSNIYFPDEEITFNDLYFVCYMIERTARHLHQHNRYVAEQMGKESLERQLSIAGTLHCMNPLQVVDDWTKEYHLEKGDFDITAIDTQFTDKVPSETQMGKVYARLVESVTPVGGNLAESILRVYASPICKTIDNYNSSAYYEPSYVHTRALLNGSF
ncbi:MAG: hypothetical protein Q4D23_04975 [Bacteroidales bacterium]|nr:hypothetical protein [Bacteroidales bacterium]